MMGNTDKARRSGLMVPFCRVFDYKRGIGSLGDGAVKGGKLQLTEQVYPLSSRVTPIPRPQHWNPKPSVDLPRRHCKTLGPGWG